MIRLALLLGVIATSDLTCQGIRFEPGVGLVVTLPTGTFHRTGFGEGFVDVTYNFALPASIVADYLVGGIGVYDVKLCLKGSSAGCQSVTKGAWNFGGRMVHRVGRRTGWFVEVRYFYLGRSSLYSVSVTPEFLAFTVGVQSLRPIGNH